MSGSDEEQYEEVRIDLSHQPRPHEDQVIGGYSRQRQESPTDRPIPFPVRYDRQRRESSSGDDQEISKSRKQVKRAFTSSPRINVRLDKPPQPHPHSLSELKRRHDNIQDDLFRSKLDMDNTFARNRSAQEIEERNIELRETLDEQEYFPSAIRMSTAVGMAYHSEARTYQKIGWGLIAGQILASILGIIVQQIEMSDKSQTVVNTIIYIIQAIVTIITSEIDPGAQQKMLERAGDKYRSIGKRLKLLNVVDTPDLEKTLIDTERRFCQLQEEFPEPIKAKVLENLDQVEDMRWQIM